MEDLTAPSINICLLLNAAVLSAVSEGRVPNILAFDMICSKVFSVVLGCPIEDLGEEFEENNSQIV